jgi:hypothetical protein
MLFAVYLHQEKRQDYVLTFYQVPSMNKRIRLLAEQAGASKLPGGELSFFGNESIERFAQLIIRECAKITLETPVEYAEIDAMHRIRDRIKDHFGVEE